ncbi:MAG: hypothetical protein NT069_13645 [Planctomycetota bacterium]|nr:hypothetical protein [Planctomycetota bacterium]
MADLEPCVYCGIEIPSKARKCRHCGEWLNERDRAKRVADSDPGLTGIEVVLFSFLFLVVPLANIIIAHILYKMWATTSIKKAKQINSLSVGCFVIQFVTVCVTATVVYVITSDFGRRW